MPMAYARDDQRRLITVMVTEPYSLGDLLSVLDRQAAEDTWEYAMLYDLRAVTRVLSMSQRSSWRAASAAASHPP
jgi:hypothetical protein